jgi:ABC-type sugar transport system permease subunit
VQQQTVRPALSAPAQAPTAAVTAAAHRSRFRFFPYLLVLPAVVILGVFHIFPIFYGFYISLHRWGVKNLGFVGFRNYSRALHDEDFWMSLRVTVWYVLGTVPTGIILALFLAILLFRPIAGRAFYRIVLFLPYVTPPIAIATVWAWMYQPDRGVINIFLSWLHLGKPRWLLDPRGLFDIMGSSVGLHLPKLLQGPSIQLCAAIIYTLWLAVGFDTVVFLAGLSNIPPDVVEAAQIDGANQWQIATRIIAPLLKPTILFLSIISTLRAFQSFNTIYGLFGGNVPPGARVITILIFQEFFQRVGQVGYGAATAILLFLLLFAITLLQLRIAEGRDDSREQRAIRGRVARGMRGQLKGN